MSKIKLNYLINKMIGKLLMNILLKQWMKYYLILKAD